MQVIASEKLKRKRRTGQFFSLISLLVLGGGLIASFNSENYLLPLVAIVFGFLLSQVGVHLGNRWGTSKTDEKINSFFQGLGDEYILHHSIAPAQHLLLGPAGLLVILPYHMDGTITYDSRWNVWKQKGGSWPPALFGSQKLGQPDEIASIYIQGMQTLLNQYAPDMQNAPVPEAMMIFTNPKVKLQVEDTPIPALTEDTIMDFLIRKTMANNASPVSIYNLSMILVVVA